MVRYGKLLGLLGAQGVQSVGGGAEGGAAGVDGLHQSHQIGAELLGQLLEGGVGAAQGGTGGTQGARGAVVQIVDALLGLTLGGLGPAVGAQLVPVVGGLLDGGRLGGGLLCLLQLLAQSGHLSGLLVHELIGSLQLLTQGRKLRVPVGEGLLQRRDAIPVGSVLIHLTAQLGKLGLQGVVLLPKLLDLGLVLGGHVGDMVHHILPVEAVECGAEILGFSHI